MKSVRPLPKSFVLSWSLCAALTLAACANGDISGNEGGEGGASPGGSGGSVGSGGSSSGGASARGGTTGTGGFSNSGGAVGSGGATASGGVTGSGGTLGTGGSKSSGGSTGSGGMLGSGGNMNVGGRGAFGGSGRGGSQGSGGATGGNMGSGGSSGMCTVGSRPGGGSSHCSSNQSGSVGSQQWTIWSSGSGGCLTTYGSSAAFSATWNNAGDFLARVGLAMGSSKTPDQYTSIAADFAEKKSGSAGGYSSIGVYGWTVSPLVEFYVVEDSYQSLGSRGTKKGTFTIDGEGTYDVYYHQQVNQPSIQGTSTFDQFFSVRQGARTCGHISLSKHFAQWKTFGLTMGKMEEAKILIEAGGGSGSIDFPTSNVTAQ